jgi:hypothetical protein
MNNAGTWWLKAAWIELGIEQAVVEVVERACRRSRNRTGGEPSRPLRVLTHAREVLVRKNETLAFMPLFENMTRLPHLDSYDDAGLGWLTEASQSYRADTMEHYLGDLTRLRVAARLGQALARCYWRAWYQSGAIVDGHVFYVDMHDKVVWTKKASPVGFVSALHETRACLKQTFVHGRGGHALWCQTYPADVHLNEVVVEVAQALEAALGQPVVQILVTDREGQSAEVIAALTQQNKGFVSLLKANQYSGEADFVRCGRFRKRQDSRTGLVTHRVADADFQLTATQGVRAALLYDLDHPAELIALITTVSREAVLDIRRVVDWYLARWNAQENAFRAQIAFVHLNTNFGLRAKRAVPDRRVAGQIAAQTRHLAAVTRKLDSKLAQLAEQERLIHNLGQRHDRQVANLLRLPKRQGPQAARRAAQRAQRLQTYRERHQHHLLKHLTRKAKLEREIEAHRQEHARVVAVLARLDPQAMFFEVDAEKDQIVAHLRLGVHNSALWARDHYFGSTYRHTTPLTLWRTFFNQDGFYRETPDRIVVTLKPFAGARVQQEAVLACQRCNERRITTLSGKLIEMHVAESI